MAGDGAMGFGREDVLVRIGDHRRWKVVGIAGIFYLLNMERQTGEVGVITCALKRVVDSGFVRVGNDR